MSFDMKGYNANDNAEYISEGWQPLPKGEYPVIVTETATRKTKDGKGFMVKLKLKVVAGDFINRETTVWLMTKHTDSASNPKLLKAVQINGGRLSSVCLAVGKPTPQSSAELHGIRFTASIKVNKEKNGNELVIAKFADGTDVKGKKAGTFAANGTSPQGQQPQQQQSTQTAEPEHSGPANDDVPF